MPLKDAGKELEALCKPGSTLERVKRARLPAPVQALVQEILSDDKLFTRHSLLRTKRSEVAPAIAGLTDRDRDRLIEALTPRLVPDVLSAWDLLSRRPYQYDAGRKPFRCPGNAETMADIRGTWLLSIAILVGDYDQDIEWVAAWAPHVAAWYGAADFGWLLAGAIDRGGASGEKVFEILKQSAIGDHEVGAMGRHVTQAFMSCSRPDAWEFVEKLLLAAQRQEGLRQAILESVDESHPDVFRRMLRVIREENLSRFSSVVRAFDTWFGFMWDGASGIKVNQILSVVERFLNDASERDAGLLNTDAETVYLALWATAFDDVSAAIPAAAWLLQSPAVEIRFVATHFLVQSAWAQAIPPATESLEDADLRVAARSLDAFQFDVTAWVDGERLFQKLEALHARVAKRSTKLDALVWPWWQIQLEKTAVATAMVANASAVPTSRLIPYIRDLDPSRRGLVLRQLAGLPTRWGESAGKRLPLTDEVRALALDFLGDPSQEVRRAAFEVLEPTPLQSDEVTRLISLLSRQVGDLRSNCLARLATLKGSALKGCIETLLGDSDALRRAAGLELLRASRTARDADSALLGMAEKYRAEHAALSEIERSHLNAILGATVQVPTLENALGLIDPALRRTWPPPHKQKVELDTRAARACLSSLVRLVLEHQFTEIDLGGNDVRTLVAAGPAIPGPGAAEMASERLRQLPLPETWRSWLADRADGLRDADGLELLRLLALEHDHGFWSADEVKDLDGGQLWQPGQQLLRRLLEWCVFWQPPAAGTEFLIRGLESSLATLTDKDFQELATEWEKKPGGYFTLLYGDDHAYTRRLRTATHWLGVLRLWREIHPAEMSQTSSARVYSLLRWFHARTNGAAALQMDLHDFLPAYGAPGVDEQEFTDLLIGSHQPGLVILRQVSGRKPRKEIARHAALLEVIERCRLRIAEVESDRGDQQTAASPAASALQWTGGLETLRLALPALGTTKFARTRGWWSGATRKETLSHLVLRSTPREQDTPEAFAAWVKTAKLKTDRLIELAVYAPQWARHVNHVLGWPGFEDAVWWLQAHTKDDRSWDLAELKEVWSAQVAERTPLTSIELTEGAVDVRWFHESYGILGAERWRKLYQSARYGSSAAGHKRAQLFADAMLGEVNEEDLVKRIEESRHQDAVRSLGLLPLSDDESRTATLLRRYGVLQEFRRGSREFGSQRKQSEERAVSVGLANLARSAGFVDPLRLQWAMEREAVADLADGPLVRQKDDIELRLEITVEGEPELSFSRAGKAIKSVPANLKKDADLVALRERATEIRRQAARVKGALEDAMCRGDSFTAAELQDLLRHPILAPAISRLAFVAEGFTGYPAEAGRVLRDHANRNNVIGTTESLRLAHPHDFLSSGDWADWQRECFRAERVQPFKQVFRELYPVTEVEQAGQRSARYAGQQVNPRQAIALLGRRGWVAHPEEGVHRTFHKEGLTARLYFQEAFYTPADVEGLTLEFVCFTEKGEHEELWLRAIPPRVFSETMRDLDLVVSVAHLGGVDPEATASTVELRAGLLRETCELLGIGNVELQANHAVVHGQLATYSVLLVSAVARVMPGTALYIVAVHSQQRGRLFLPFADNDPKTAEVLSKVLLFARDRDIKDPSILQQIRLAS